MRRIATILLATAILLAFCFGGCTSPLRADTPPADALQNQDAGTFEVTSYNIHGLPSSLTRDNTPDRMQKIAQRLRGFTGVFLMQEHFLRGESSPTEDIPGHTFGHLVRFTKRTGWSIYGSGLAALSSFPIMEDGVKKHHYTVCNGELSAGNDCLASKGFLVIRIQLAFSVEIDVYTTHLDAGSSDEDAAAREQQLAELLESIQDYSAGRAVIVLGDFNIRWDRTGDRKIFNTFLVTAGLLVAPTGAATCPEHFKLDGGLFKSGKKVTLTVFEERYVREIFRDEEGYLSDHHPVSYLFGWHKI